MYLILINYIQPIDVVDQHLADHREFLGKGYDKDYFVVSGPKNPREGGIIISQLKDKDQLQKIIEQDPFFVNKIASYEIIEFSPVKYHPNFSSFI
jgi:uncharacterized protein YciI